MGPISLVGRYEVGGSFLVGTSAAVSGVPEASTWTMMLLGFCGLGFLAFRKAHDGNITPIMGA